MPNTSRGEVELTLDGRRWTVRPTFQKIREIENATGASTPTLVRPLGAYDIGIGSLARMVAIALGDHDDAPDYDAVGEILMRDGIDDTLVPMLMFLSTALLGVKVKNLSAPQAEARTKSPGGA